PSWLSSDSTMMAPGPPSAPPGAPLLGAATNRSPLGAKTSARASPTSAYFCRHIPAGSVAPGTAAPPAQAAAAGASIGVGALGPSAVTPLAASAGDGLIVPGEDDDEHASVAVSTHAGATNRRRGGEIMRMNGS